ncbi:MAG: DUF1553 domain-containing protein [Planctomycetaceae bacterium]|nr:DUF1553 domain-containing protein [Planctomycetaceae bacterium]
MRPRLWPLPAVAFCAGVALLTSSAPAAPLDFNRDVKPILSNACFKCHGFDPAERKGGTDGLRLDTADGATVDLGGYAAIVPGKPEQSELLKRVTAEDESAMPPKGSGKRLTPKEVQILTEWIKQGAKYSQHWAYVKPVRSAVPTPKDAAWPRNDIDRFLLARLEKEGLKPQPEADRYALIRRLSLDLTGLPPTLKEVDEFVADKSPDAYEKLVDRLLAKDAYGEHWAHMWLDLARYADSAGYADDPARTIWLFRDYVIRSLNANKPFDQFTIEQIAGDLLPNPTDDQLIATAFHRNTLTNNEGGTNDEEFRNVAIVDRVNTTFAVWMGTTIACAQCHNHKYDPISQEEFFRVFALFNNTEDADRGDESPLFSLYTDSQKKQREEWQADLANLDKALKTVTPEIQAAQSKWDAAFPRNLAWKSPKPAAVKTESGSAAEIADDAAVKVAAGAKNDTYTIDLQPGATSLRALRVEAIPDASLPGGGSGHAGGNFILTKVTANIVPPTGAAGPKGRYVRVENTGAGKFLHLAEVQVFRGADNLALKGDASQVSTDYGGDAKRANDGNTNGDYAQHSVAHTAAGDNPWWEVDLKDEAAIDRIVVWNRTDATTADRLANWKVTLLNTLREPVWQETIADSPKPSREFSLTGARGVTFAAVAADFAQSGYEATNVLNNANPKQKGWAIGGALNQPHSLTLISNAPVEVPAGATLRVTLEHAAQMANHTLGKFRISLTDDARAAEWSRTPFAVVEALRTPADKRTPQQQDSITQHYLSIAPELAATRQKHATVTKQLSDLKPTTVPIFRELKDNMRRVTKIQHRGNFLDLGNEVKEGLPAVFPAPPADQPMNRLTLAKWLVDENNPLTARVIANRYWEQLFGIGIVSTSEEFGTQGDLPVHPELLDWLATELVRAKWDMKAFLKTLVTSAAYRQSSKVTPDLDQRDPDNRLLARGPRFRLSAEMVRDQALAVSGLLSAKLYGPPVKPPQPSMGLSAAFGSGIDWQTSAGEDKYRRGLYTTWRRSNPYPSMAAFDAPNREVCTVRRVRTNTPLQALVTLNDPVYIEAAQALARHILLEGGSTSTDQAVYAFRRVLARPPHDAERSRIVALYEKSLAKFQKDLEQAKRMSTDPLGPPLETLKGKEPELAAWTVISNVLLNLDEALMKR